MEKYNIWGYTVRSPQEFQDHCFQRAPLAITPEIRAFARHLSPSFEPSFVPVRHSSKDQPVECFYNVLRRVEAGEGEMLYGWAISEWPRVFLEAEHHAVLSTEIGLIDVTPALPPENQILFVPAPSLSYDFENNRRIFHERWPLSKSRKVAEYLAATREIFEVNEENSVGRRTELSGEPLRRCQYLSMVSAQLKQDIITELLRGTGRNDPCICASGLKFKKCCGGT